MQKKAAVAESLEEGDARAELLMLSDWLWT